MFVFLFCLVLNCLLITFKAKYWSVDFLHFKQFTQHITSIYVGKIFVLPFCRCFNPCLYLFIASFLIININVLRFSNYKYKRSKILLSIIYQKKFFNLIFSYHLYRVFCLLNPMNSDRTGFSRTCYEK